MSVNNNPILGFDNYEGTPQEECPKPRTYDKWMQLIQEKRGW